MHLLSGDEKNLCNLKCETVFHFYGVFELLHGSGKLYVA